MFTASRSIIKNSTRIIPRTNSLFIRNRIPLYNNYKQTMNLMTISQSLDESYTKHKIIPDVVDMVVVAGVAVLCRC